MSPHTAAKLERYIAWAAAEVSGHADEAMLLTIDQALALWFRRDQLFRESSENMTLRGQRAEGESDESSGWAQAESATATFAARSVVLRRRRPGEIGMPQANNRGRRRKMTGPLISTRAGAAVTRTMSLSKKNARDLVRFIAAVAMETGVPGREIEVRTLDLALTAFFRRDRLFPSEKDPPIR